jgi:hypothetical protein
VHDCTPSITDSNVTTSGKLKLTSGPPRLGRKVTSDDDDDDEGRECDINRQSEEAVEEEEGETIVRLFGVMVPAARQMSQDTPARELQYFVFVFVFILKSFSLFSPLSFGIIPRLEADLLHYWRGTG